MTSEKAVKDLMHPLGEYYRIAEERSVAEALVLMERARRKGKPLCLIVAGDTSSEKEIIKGFVTPRELVFGLTTRFLKGAEKSGPIFWEGQFEAECLAGMNKLVREIMDPINAYVRGTEMLMEAVFLLKKYQEDFLPVISKEEVVGIIHIHDILTHTTRLAPEKHGASKVHAFPF